jgi:hypothetical protein
MFSFGNTLIYKGRMMKIYRKVLVLALLALPVLSQAQSLDTVVTKQLKTGWNLVGFMGQTPEQTKKLLHRLWIRWK